MRLAAIALMMPLAAQAQTPLYPFLEMQPTFPDALSAQMVTAIQYAGSGGAQYVACWAVIEKSPGVYSFPALAQLAAAMRPGQGLVLGLKAGNCVPGFEAQNSVPAANIWWANLAGKSGACVNYPAYVAPWNSQVIQDYLAATQAMWNAAAQVTLSDGSTLQSHIVALQQGLVVKPTSTGLMLPATGCTHGGTVYQTAYQAAEAWHAAGYTPALMQAGWSTYIQGLLAIGANGPAGPVPVAMVTTGDDNTAFPLVKANGLPIGPNAKRAKVPMSGPMAQQCITLAQAAGTQCLVSWNAMSGPGGKPALPALLLQAWQAGATPIGETNGVATLNGKPDMVTSYLGQGDTTPATPSQFVDIVSTNNQAAVGEAGRGLSYMLVQPWDPGTVY